MTTEPTALDRLIEQVEAETFRIAEIGCYLVDKFQREHDAASLDELQDFVRLALQVCLDRIRILRGRNRRRKKHFTKRMTRKPELGKRIKNHNMALRRRMGTYVQRRSLLRQIGDAAAWVALGSDLRKTGPLTRAQTHELPEQIGLVGVLHAKADIHGTGQLLAIENDLTRFIGFGDLTVVRTDHSHATPVPLEVKTHELGTDGSSTEIGITMLTAATNLPVDVETIDLLKEHLSSENGDLVPISERSERQSREIGERMEIVARLMLRRGAAVSGPAVRHWSTLARVINRARGQRHAFDIAESGLFYYAVWIDGNEGFKSSLEWVRDRVLDLTGSGVGLIGTTTVEFAERSDLAGLVPPVALWSLPLRLRAEVLVPKVLVGTFMVDNLIQKLFASRGIQLERVNKQWHLRRSGADTPWVLARYQSAALELGVTIACMSPKEIVQEIASAMEQ